ncbi:flagellar biosynthesis protein FlhA [Thermosipho africanus H17ap60334]|jgi:flagellar biosynthesis protein FlhA|uniref:Flagellar biosynthesis protein FlhA n=1 Tax=Thermosipho africanus (strain TCF52B) TaxID=484019 RepID=B7IDW2_THEAB|nr:flagellar biosynthesis protein FlhA [Thermosipho africanus]ACJ76189.1 flagellar biosynthesis protein FlhA [Thermosipho africanus TCF52B]EKF49329.1 flagellar biosynthesis protein FlhA [Thermosipho africanus H17ap60334]MDK2839858.1 flagellar biosynthesis protein FlhA [Thermosipho sp. (in: thermotogales)]RDI92042.1 flagellar biosynthesis protein FlhA [Thermosipho africanus Ob7]
MAKGTDIIVAIMIAAIVLLMILPIPGFLLDFFQLLNLSLSLIILFSTMYIRKALELSSFPTILLVITLFRLGLNVASTRLILLQGPKFSGKVIRAFGDFVVGGNYVVGLVVFLILVIIQFIVITRGSERIAEVAARFTLDAMPGKQMSVDADLNAGLITEDEARKRREEIRREADFYGAMDGASKFVRGDAIASIIIVLVNIIGGLIIGILTHKMTVSEAAQTFTLFTVGDGLVTQIPALMVSTATGILVSRAASEDNLGNELVRELSGEKKVIILTGFILIFLGIFTPIPFSAAILGTLFMITGFLIKSTTEPQLESIGGSAEIPTAQTPSGPILTTPQEVSEILQTDTVEVEIGYGLIPLADTSQGGDLLERVTMVRKQIAYELGLVISPIRVRDSVLLKSNEYAIFIRGAQVAKYELMPNRLLAINPGTVTEKIPGIETKEPAFGLQAFWIDESKKEEASRLGYTVVDPPTVFATHLTEVLKRNAHELLGTREFELLVEGLRSKFEKLVDDLFNVLKPSDVKKVLQRLLKEGIPIRNLSLIFETLLEYGEQTKDVIYLTEKVRKAMKRQIITPLISPDGILHAVAIDNELEKNLVNLVRENDTERYLDLNPEIMRELIESISNSLENIMKKGYNPVLICSSSLRPLISDLLLKFIPGVYVISYDEIPENVSMQIEGVVRL